MFRKNVIKQKPKGNDNNHKTNWLKNEKPNLIHKGKYFNEWFISFYDVFSKFCHKRKDQKREKKRPDSESSPIDYMIDCCHDNKWINPFTKM